MTVLYETWKIVNLKLWVHSQYFPIIMFVEKPSGTIKFIRNFFDLNVRNWNGWDVNKKDD